MFFRGIRTGISAHHRFFSTSALPKGKVDLGIYVFGGITALTCGLGAWQSARYFWKVDLLKTRKESLSLEPIDISERQLTEEEANVSFRRIQVRGVLDTNPAHQVVLTPRVAPKDVPQRLLTAAQAGYNLIAPFISDGGEKMMVIRGWVPADVKLSSLGPTEASDGQSPDNFMAPTTIFGVLRSNEEPGVFGVSSKSESPMGGEIPVATKEPLPSDRKDVKYKSGDNYRGSAGVLTYINREKIAQLLGFIRKEEAEEGVTSMVKKAPPLPLLIEQIQPFPDASLPPSQRYPITRQFPQLSDAYVQPHTHVIYAATWFTLSVFGYFLTKRRFKGSARGAMRKLSSAYK